MTLRRRRRVRRTRSEEAVRALVATTCALLAVAGFSWQWLLALIAVAVVFARR